MKTKIYFTTLLAFTIQVMVNGQTQGTQASDKLGTVLKHSSSAKKETTVDGKKVIGIAKEFSFTSENTASETTESLIQKSDALRVAAQSAKGISRTKLIAQANLLFNQAQAEQIKAFELSGKQNKITFEVNKASISQLLAISNISATTGKEIQNLISDAGLNMRLALEMRQEAYAMPTEAAKAGSLSNADEKETIAISEQNEALHILKSYAASTTAGIDLNSLAMQ